jgi:hypothetical protein
MEIIKEVMSRFFFIVGVVAFFLLLFTAIVESSNASECAKPVQVIKVGEVANCSGFLFSDKAEKDAATARDNVEYYKTYSSALEQKVTLELDRNKILEKRLDLYIDQTNKLTEKSAQLENNNFYKNVGLFFLGGLAMYAAYNVAN